MLAARLGSLHIPPITFLYFVLFFVLGFMLFAALFMVIGAVSSTATAARHAAGSALWCRRSPSGRFPT